MTKIILTNKGEEITVSDEDYPTLSKYTWYISQGRGGSPGYPMRTEWKDGKGNRIYMHRQILNPTGRELVDHIDRNKLNNTRPNLRIVDYSINEQNKASYRGGRYKGVSWNKYAKKFQAYITKDGRRSHLGYFTNENDAARIYNFWALDLYGEHAMVNQIND